MKEKRENIPQLVLRCQCNLDIKIWQEHYKKGKLQVIPTHENRCKLLNRIILNLILTIIDRTIHYDRLGVFQESKVDLTFEDQSMYFIILMG